jgi:hypothetical protein
MRNESFSFFKTGVSVFFSAGLGTGVVAFETAE